ncbi:T6SS immunity protein Tli4 family protein [Pseudomonas sp.]|uniref:T6SS immunity protein Tli4 family protein n=1 Tax=Pseudomonas sp. TaxID=306 RepID=UPI0026071E7C|nr:T6SS immunity protein Tli4 family protein [Pseudomonas sp.]
MKLLKKTILACFIGGFSFALQAKTPAIPDDWKTECVGYFQISLPGEIEVGVVQSDPDPSKGTHNLQNQVNHFFADSFYTGGIRTSSELPERSFSRINNVKPKEIEELKGMVAEDAPIDTPEYKTDDNTLIYTLQDKSGATASTFIYQAGRIYFFRTSEDELPVAGAAAKVKSRQANFLQNFRPRALYEVPQEKGFCMPYGFVKDDSPQKRSMGTIMRLKDHPDVRILFRDQSASFMKSYSGEENPTVEKELRAFWERPDWDGVNYQALGFRKFPSVQMGGYKGQSTFVEITRSTRSKGQCTWDDQYFSKAEKKEAGCLPQTKDYGYIAYVKGDPDAKEDTPNLLLYVMQDSEDAPDGKPTIGKDELRKMADTIAASIKRR